MRGQLDTAVGMILTIVIVVAVLTLAVWGFNELTKTSSEAAYRAVSDSLSEAGARYASFGSQAVVYVNAPEPFCIFNTSADPGARLCTPGYSGHVVCDSANFIVHWIGVGTEDGNLVFRSGINERLDLIAPHNGAYACFRSGRQPVFIEGRGRYSTVSPMREIRSIALHKDDLSTPLVLCDGGSTGARLSIHTYSPQGSSPDLLVFERNGVSDTVFCSPIRFEMQVAGSSVILHDDPSTQLLVPAASDPNQYLQFTGHTFSDEEIIMRP